MSLDKASIEAPEKDAAKDTAKDAEGQALVEVHDLTVSFGALRAVDGLSFRLEKGAALGLVGESGSG